MQKFLKLVSMLILLIFLRTSFAISAEQVYYYYTDPAGTPLAMSDANGTVVWRADYLPFGEETIDQATVQNNKMFVGKEQDSESGLYYFGARYMDPTAGRFTSTDRKGPIDPRTGKLNQLILANPQRLNIYAYGLNNPHKFVDLDGNSAIFITVQRSIITSESQIGTLIVNSKSFGVTLELPYNNNMQDVSSIPAGTYLGKFVDSPTKGKTIEIEVNGRTHVLFHIGNDADDSKGCVLVGSYVSREPDYIEKSADAFKDFKKFVYGIKNMDERRDESTDIIIDVKGSAGESSNAGDTQNGDGK